MGPGPLWARAAPAPIVTSVMFTSILIASLPLAAGQPQDTYHQPHQHAVGRDGEGEIEDR
jgi:hypothetical protein